MIWAHALLMHRVHFGQNKVEFEDKLAFPSASGRVMFLSRMKYLTTIHPGLTMRFELSHLEGIAPKQENKYCLDLHN